MRQDYTDITILLDKSGSMAECWDLTMKSLNVFLTEQKTVDGKLSVSIYAFDTSRHHLLSTENIKNIDKITDCFPGGDTALNDALVTTIDDTGNKLAKLKESDRPAKVLFVVLTDGQENHSTKYTKEDVKQRIIHQESKYSWNFIFLGADYNAIPDAISYGVKLGNIYNYNKLDTEKEWKKMSVATSCFRGSQQNVITNFSEQVSQN